MQIIFCLGHIESIYTETHMPCMLALTQSFTAHSKVPRWVKACRLGQELKRFKGCEAAKDCEICAGEICELSSHLAGTCSGTVFSRGCHRSRKVAA